MRRTRRGGLGMEFGGSGEDSFVAVVVTKLTGALLFILLLTMVIMALIPKAVDRSPIRPADRPAPVLAIATPGALPEAIAGRPYALALAATGASGPAVWALDGPIPDGLALDPASGILRGTPRAGTPSPVPLTIRVSDGAGRATRPATLAVYESAAPLGLPSRWRPALPPIPWRAWMEQGFGFLLLILVHMVGMNTLDAAARRAIDRAEAAPGDDGEIPGAVESISRRFRVYRWMLRVASAASIAALVAWLRWPSP